MVLYQLADQISVNNMFFIDNSNYNNEQVGAASFECVHDAMLLLSASIVNQEGWAILTCF